MTSTTRDLSPRRRLLPLALTAGVVAADQVVKALVVRLLPYGRPVPVIGEFLRFTHVTNTAIAFSIGRGLADPARLLLSLVVPVLVMALLLGYFLLGRDLSRAQRWLLAAILGGGLGNIVDRLFRHQAVVDFVDVKFYGLFGLERWPVFNLADSTVVVAGIALMVSFLFGGRGEVKR
jgi:signal peptidase II